MKTQALITNCLLLFLFLGCSKDDDNTFTPTLPPITQTGANTFGCYIDGVLVTPRDGSGANGFPDRGMLFSAGGIPPEITYNEINVVDFKSEFGTKINIHIKNLNDIGQGEYVINESNCEDNVDSNDNNNIFCRFWNEASQTYKWYCSVENSGTLSITRYDFQNKIVSGTFSCTLQNRDNPDEIIEITDGRFDIKWDINTNYP